ncbi:MAG: hypothetical protein GWO02_17730, partial [Gammaproteobacteria bacterium]|nr:hypothetical protein [Gammaproteobacteria bacterium]
RAAVDAQEIAGEQAARTFLSIGFSDKFQKKDYEGALPYFETALQFATEAHTQGMAHYFIGFVLYDRGLKTQAPSTAASAREALPIFQKALDHFQKSRPYSENNQQAKLQDWLNNTQQYIEIQEALIKRGR